MNGNDHLPRQRLTASRVTALLLLSGVLAWAIALGAVALGIRSNQRATQSAPPVGVARLPTLAAQAVTLTPTFTRTPTRTPSPTVTPTEKPPISPTPAPTEPATPMPAEAAPPEPVATAGETAPAPMAVAGAGESPQGVAAQPCAPPAGWEPYTVQPDDTLFAFVLGAGATLTVDDLMAANCLTSRYLRVDQTIYLPPGAAENAPPSVPSGPATDLGARGPRPPNCPCTITVGVGWRREQIADAINAAQTLFTGGDFLAATGPGAAPPFDFTAERPPGSTLEGFLFPGTYTAQNDTTAEQFRDMLLSAFAANVTPQMRADAAAQGVSFYQALIIASIVQRETRAPEMQPLVASVLYNRLRDGNRLAQTVTVQYALGGPGNWWPRVTASGLQVDSPYNSYTRRGLPPGPIDSPGLSAFMGAIYPAQTEYRYHTAACGGGIAFAVTYEEHLANVNCE
ncbi:MAG: endolytic transglycosylase MltG [Anaerolineae bacterium]|nr:endolytic transglycosylase MltG [Anaerolineae bacterium]